MYQRVRKCIPPNQVHRQHHHRNQHSRSRGTEHTGKTAKSLHCPHPAEPSSPLKTQRHVLPHKSQEHEEDQADEPPCCGKGLGHGQGSRSHDEVEHVHEANLQSATGSSIRVCHQSSQTPHIQPDLKGEGNP